MHDNDTPSVDPGVQAPGPASSSGPKNAMARKSPTRVVRVAWLAVLVGVVIVGLATGLQVSLFVKPPFVKPTPTPRGKSAPSAQDIYKAMLGRDRQSLDRGLLAYSPIGTLKTGASTDFEVIVVDIGRGPQKTIVTKLGGLLVYQQDVPTGGIIGVYAMICQNLKCDLESSTILAVLYRGDKAKWLWQITAGTPGPAKIILRVDTYDQGSLQTLNEEIIPVTGMVVPTAAFNRQQSHKQIANLTKSGVDLIGIIGSVAGTIVAVGTLIGWLIMKRRQRKRGSHVRTSRPPKRKAASSSRTRDASKRS
jgi:hypothetical protein